MTTFLGVGIAIAAYFNGKYIKEGIKETRQMIKELGENLGKIVGVTIELKLFNLHVTQP